jgi:RNA polymerase sigma-70 factor (ECF subfamily)
MARDGASLARLAASYELDPALREDLFQEICLAIWRALKTWRGESSVRTFVFRIAHNRAVTHVIKRAGGRTRSLDDLEVEPAAIGRSLEERIDLKLRAERLQEAIARLPLGHRQVVLMALEGFKMKEVAEILGITENAVAVRLTKAKKLLRDQLTSLEKKP